jgi:aspartyl-tRNA(Asn)/glutamyl-tRNA(Gln) amidotransferase subunit A
MNDELAYQPMHVLSKRIRERKLSARELLDVYLERIRHYDGKLHAFVEVHENEARAAAARADGALEAGAAVGPLHGVPIAYKDLLHVEGTFTRGGSVGVDRRADLSATAVRRLSAAGMIAIGKTHMVEAAFGSWGTNTVAGTPWNPWDFATHRVPGGSSSGSGVAVAAALAPAALGSDTGGSVRIPASLCGIVGLKVTVGRISNHGVLMLSDTLDTLGPMTRDVEDAALVFDSMHGPDEHDARTQSHPRTDVLGSLKRGVKGMRFAIFPPEALGRLDPETARAFDDALEVFRKLGASIETVVPPERYKALADATGTIIAAEGYEKLQARIESNSPPMDEDVRTRIAAGKNVTAVEYIRILAERRTVMAELDSKLEGFDALLTPTTPSPAMPVAECDQRVAPMSRFTRAVNLLDRCALALPCGFTEGGLPLSLQIVGRGYDEARVLRIGWAYENATEWHTRRPALR